MQPAFLAAVPGLEPIKPAIGPGFDRDAELNQAAGWQTFR